MKRDVNLPTFALMVMIFLLCIIGWREAEAETAIPKDGDGRPGILPPAGRTAGAEAGNHPAATFLAQTTPRYYDEQLLNYRLTEFCATVKPPPKALVEGIQAAAQAGSTDAQIAFMWLVRIMERYEKNRCGDA